jgi:TonB family protein
LSKIFAFSIVLCANFQTTLPTFADNDNNNDRRWQIGQQISKAAIGDKDEERTAVDVLGALTHWQKVTVLLTIDQAGQCKTSKIETSSGNNQTDDQIIALITKAAPFHPQSNSGDHVYRVWLPNIFVDDADGLPPPNSMPRGTTSLPKARPQGCPYDNGGPIVKDFREGKKSYALYEKEQEKSDERMEKP